MRGEHFADWGLLSKGKINHSTTKEACVRSNNIRGMRELPKARANLCLQKWNTIKFMHPSASQKKPLLFNQRNTLCELTCSWHVSISCLAMTLTSIYQLITQFKSVTLIMLHASCYVAVGASKLLF